jgi:hypothetical protein
MQEEIKSRLNLDSVCYHFVQNLLSLLLLFKNTKIKTYKAVILPLVLYGCETWSKTLRKEQCQMVSKNRVLRETLGLRGRK